ncbi:MAG: Mur ligase family protein, partial [Planctomycetota bacterium]
MIEVRLAELHAACGVRWTAGPEGAGEILIDGVTTDSRGDVDGKLFVGIPGPRFDGARFAAAAVEGGARAVLVEEGAGVEEVLSSLAEIEGVAVATCADAVAALGAMAALVRGRSTAAVVGITGSCGKTSTKEILATLLGATEEVCASRASFNNHIGVPLTLLEVTSTARSLIVEIGTNHPGEIAPLAALAPVLIECAAAGEAEVTGCAAPQLAAESLRLATELL